MGLKQSLGKNSNLSQTDQCFLYHTATLSSGGKHLIWKKKKKKPKTHSEKNYIFISSFISCSMTIPHPKDLFKYFQLIHFQLTSSFLYGTDTLLSAYCVLGSGACNVVNKSWRSDVTCPQLWIVGAVITAEDE